MIYNETLQAMLQEPVIVRMTVIDPNGYPHTVPVWFGVDGEDLMVISFRKTRKNDYLQKNPKGNISIGGDPAEKPGYLIKGQFFLEEDADQRWLKEVTYHYEPKAIADEHIAEWGKNDMIVLRFKPEKVTKT
jgi:general stress protein 26